MILSEKIKNYRSEKNLTQNELADELDISRSQLAMIESNKRPISKQLRNKLAEISGKSLKWWITDTEYDESSYKEMTAMSMLLDYMIDKGVLKSPDDVYSETDHIMKMVAEEVRIKLKNKEKIEGINKKE